MFGVLFRGVFFLSCAIVTDFCESRQCSGVSKRTRPEYFLVAMCHRSKHTAIAVANRSSLPKCKSLARAKNGMAFNFSPRWRNMFGRFKNHTALHSCMVFSCPEVENSTSLYPDSRFDYYSAYADPIPPVNSTCIEGIGVFVVHQSKANYSSSKFKCRKVGAGLPDIATELRTKKLSQMIEDTLPKNDYRQAYVGLEDAEDTGNFVRSNGLSLSCSAFRAWAPGHPKRPGSKRTCCTLDHNNMWRVSNCLVKLPYICEIYPGGWYEDYNMFEQIACLRNDLFEIN